MEDSIDKSPPIKPELKLGLKVKPKHKSPKTIKKGFKQKSPNKLSTLDNWLKTLYQSHSQTDKTTLNKETEKPKGDKIAVSAKLVVRLEKVDLLQLQKTINSQNPKISASKEKKIKGKPKKRVTDRTSEYIKLDDKRYKCAKCDFTDSTLIKLRGHYDREHNNQIYKCNICPFQTTQQYYFNNHVRHHSRPDMECPHCQKMIKWFSYKTHIKTHERNDKTEYKCTVCEYQSYNHANVKRHMLTNHKNPYELETFSCLLCNYVTILEERLRQHTKKVHTKEGNWVTCPHCEYTTRSKSHMNRHVTSLHTEKNVQCTECSGLFSSKENLKYHILRRHTDESQRKFYYCEMCPKDEQYKTTEKGNLARHILAHRTLDEIEVFACHKCPYLGKSKSALKIHLINAHFPEMHEHKCKICGYSTSTKSRYKNHVKLVHGKPKTFKKGIKQSGETNVNALATMGGTDVEVKEELDEDMYQSADDVDNIARRLSWAIYGLNMTDNQQG